jgi:alpha-tubulin suppressor-like RCC1 family protein
MRKGLVLILSLTFFLSVFLTGNPVQADMLEATTEAYEYYEEIEIANVEYGYDVGSIISTDGRVFMWGANYYGDIGDGTKERRLLPVEITQNFNLEEEEQIIKIDFGESHTTALSSEGRVFAWGDNDYGQIGNGTFVNELLPIDITDNFVLSPEDKIIDIAIGAYHCAAISSLGEVFMWGDNENGKINDGSDDYFEFPTNITSTFVLDMNETIVKMSLGLEHTMALSSEGKVFTWGANDAGALGDGSTTRSSIPLDISTQFVLDSTETITEIVAGNYVSLALTSNGNIFTWGNYENGELGDGSVGNRLSPVRITSRFGFSEDEYIAQVDYGQDFFVARTNKNRVFGWGYNNDYQLGTPTNDTQFVPFDMTLFLGLEETEDVIDISAGAYNTAVLTSLNNLYAWGYNGDGQIGNGVTMDSALPVNINQKFNITIVNQFSLAEDETIYDVAMGYFNYVVVTSYGRVFTWGLNDEGQLGNGTTINSSIPIDITSSLNLDVGEKVLAAECGEEHVVILTNTGTVYTWGDNEFGQLGDGTTTSSLVPVELDTTLFNSEPVEYISSYGDVVSAITSTDTLYTWGNNGLGQMGDGTTVSKSVPTDVTSSFGLAVDETITKIEFGLYFSTALTSDGRYFTWGYNNSGQLGNGSISTTPIATPIEMDLAVFGGETITDISAGYSHAAVITSSGKLYTWGLNNNGQLGDGTQVSSSTPTEVPASNFGGETIASVQLGFVYSTAITSSGNLYTWGNNSYAQLGLGDRTHRYIPTAADTFFDGENIVKLGLGKQSVIAISDTFELYRWGDKRIGPSGEAHYDLVPVRLLNMNQIERVYSPYTNEYYNDFIPVSVFPTYDIGNQLYSITINGVEYLSDVLTVSNGRIDVMIHNVGVIDQTFDIVLESISFIQGNSIDVEGMNSTSTTLYDFEAPTFSISILAIVEIGDTTYDYTTHLFDIEDNSDTPVTLEVIEDTVLYDTIGTYSVTLRAVDASMNEKIGTIVVEVVDTTSPVITLYGNDTVYIEQGDSYTELGALFTDNSGLSGDATVSGDTVDTSTPGTYIIEYDAEDTEGNIALTVQRTVIVQDTTDPVVSGVIADKMYEKGTEVTITFNEGTGTLNGEVFESGSMVSESGEYTLVVTDASGNITTTTFTIEDGTSVLVYVLVIGGLMLIGAGAFLAKKFIFDKS